MPSPGRSLGLMLLAALLPLALALHARSASNPGPCTAFAPHFALAAHTRSATSSRHPTAAPPCLPRLGFPASPALPCGTARRVAASAPEVGGRLEDAAPEAGRGEEDRAGKIWEAADARGLEEGLRLNAREHAAECTHLQGASAFYSGARTLKAVCFSDVDTDAIPFQVGSRVVSAYRSAAPLFSTAECQAVIEEAEAYAASQPSGWSTQRHANYPTTDIPIKALPAARKWFDEALEQKVFPFLAHSYPSLVADPDELRIFDVFIVKYDATQPNGQRQLSTHRDSSLLSLNIALNDGFEGGGTWIDALSQAVRQSTGGVLSHPSGALHGGHGITSGVRYILVGFLLSKRHPEHLRRFMDRGSALLHEGMLDRARRTYEMARAAVAQESGGGGRTTGPTPPATHPSTRK